MQRPIILAFLFLSLIVAPTTAQSPRIDPAGIPGALVLFGGEISVTAAERFVELAGGEKARIVFVKASANPKKKDRFWSEEKIIGDAAAKAGAITAKRITLAKVKEGLRGATGVCLLVEDPGEWLQGLVKFPVAGEFRAVLKRGGVLAGDPSAIRVLASPAGLDLLPGGLFDAESFTDKGPPLKERMKTPGLVGFKMEFGGALLVQGRTISAIGDKKSTILVTGQPTTREIVVEGKTKADLTALRRSAHDRAQSFPPKKVETPFVEKGTLVIVGGGGQPENLTKTFVEYAGGAGKANIVIFPTANEDTNAKRDFLATAFKKAGAKNATVLYGRTQAEVESKEFLDTLKEATGLWFDGGRQWRFVDCYENTKALPLMFDVLNRGGVIGGTSAGATIQGDYLARGGVFNNLDIRYEGYERGLGFLKGVAIDQHFTQRKRQGDMTQLMKAYPQYLGIGIDEATAIVVKGHTADVIGKGKVHFYDTNRKFEKGQPDHEALSAGGRYDLKDRKILATK